MKTQQKLSSMLVLCLIGSSILATGLNASSHLRKNNDAIEVNESIEIKEINDTLIGAGISTSFKQRVNYSKLACPVSNFNFEELLEQGIKRPKQLSALVPSLLMADYGSSMTSSIYMRGFGSRIGSPVLGLYVDDIPITEKNAYDFDLMDIHQADILRGPQGTIYGRNSLCGVMSLTTMSPGENQGQYLTLEYGSKNRALAKYSYYGKKLGVALAYRRSGGFYTNKFDNSTADRGNALSMRLKYKENLNSWIDFENILSLNWSKEDGFPYAPAVYQMDGKPQKPGPGSKKIFDHVGDINYNDPSNYNRLFIVEGAKFRFKLPVIEIKSITSLQILDDKMSMDQDFSPAKMFSTSQSQKNQSLTQEIIITPENHPSWWDSQTGVFAYVNRNHKDVPVGMGKDGVKFMEGMFNRKLASIPHMPNIELNVIPDNFTINDDFKGYTYNTAAYHESYFSFGNWLFTIGGRLEYEHQTLDYDCNTSVDFNFVPKSPHPGGNPGGNPGVNPGMPSFPEIGNKTANPIFKGNYTNSYWEAVPKISAVYSLLGDVQSLKLYGIYSQGYRSGGFNTQLFSEILKSDLIKEFMKGLPIGKPGSGKPGGGKPGTQPGKPGTQPGKPGTQPGKPSEGGTDLKDLAKYKPEKSHNLETGFEYNLHKNGHNLNLSSSIYYIKCENQQLTVMPQGNTTTGRMTANAGKSTSYGVEASAQYNYKGLNAIATYGYTKAKFKDYVYDAKNNIAYDNMYIPYQPKQTIYARISYKFNPWANSGTNFVIGADYKGIGDIYWNETNTIRQPFYGEYGADISYNFKNLTLYTRFENISNKKFNTFYFKSMGKEFFQIGKPFRFNIGLHYNF